jgi:hypothetical protein
VEGKKQLNKGNKETKEESNIHLPVYAFWYVLVSNPVTGCLDVIMDLLRLYGQHLSI